MKLDGGRGLTCAAIAVAAAWLIDRWRADQLLVGVVAAVATIWIVLILAAPGGLTLGQRISRRRRRRKPLRAENMLHAVAGGGAVWDGQHSCMYVSFAPSPFQLCLTDVPDPVLPPPVPVDLLRTYLHQGNIHVDSISILQGGYRRYARSPYGDVYFDMVGDTAAATNVSTVIEVAVSLNESLDAVKERNLTGKSSPAALGACAHLVASRVARGLNVAGYESRILTPSDVRWFQASIQSWMNDGLRNEQRTHLAGKVAAVASWPGEWTARAATKWWAVPADRYASAFAIKPTDRYGQQRYSGALAFAYPAAADFPDGSYYLERAQGEQGDVVTSMMPMAKTVTDTRLRQQNLRPGAPFPIEVPGTGLGIYLGEGKDGGRAFMNLMTGGETMYVHGPAELMALLIARASAVGARIGVHLDGPGWPALAGKVNPDMITIRPDKRCALEVYKDHPPRRIGESTSVLVWCPKAVPSHAAYSMVTDRDGNATVSTPMGDLDFRWRPSERERAFLPGTTPAVSAQVG